MIKESLLAFIISLEGFSSCAYLDCKPILVMALELKLLINGSA
jgi:hypothetical protein